MAVCKRCKTPFNYEKREGVCPKCCFYNRPTGTWQEDSSWIKNYGYDDTYTPPVMSDDGYDDKDDGLRSIFSHGGKEMDGSHKHLENGKVVRGSKAVSKKRTVTPKTQMNGKPKKKGGCFSVIFVIFWFYVIMMFLGHFFS